MKQILLVAALMLGTSYNLSARTDADHNQPVNESTPATETTVATDEDMTAPALPDATTLIARADSAYNADNFSESADLYNLAIDNYGSSATLYYNLGNTYYRMGESGNAIIAYERALRLDPSDHDTRENLAFVNARITDRPGERGTFLGNALDAAATSAPSNTWAWAGMICILLTLGGVLAYMLSSSVPVRKTGFFGGLAALALSAACLFLAFRSASIASADNIAVVTVPSTILSTVPRVPQDRNQEAMLLHEGTKVSILDSVRSTTDSINSVWYDVEVDNAHRAWINARAVRKI